ncbi:MAG: Crp/Fnr family transcriptional regulator [Lachnospiraceae bacterium]|nr:Crp/Fnr family transcriptional regulator [Lachnospiraceae bacterium]
MDNTGKIISFPQDSVILKEGEINIDMYKILQGNVELYTGYGTDQEVLLGIIGPQSCFGEFGLLLHQPAIYTVVAYTDVYAMRVSEGEMGDFVQQNHKNIIDIMRNMARMMMLMQHQIDLLSEDVKTAEKDIQDIVKRTQRNIRNYAVYNPKDPWYDKRGKMHFLNRPDLP